MLHDSEKVPSRNGDNDDEDGARALHSTSVAAAPSHMWTKSKQKVYSKDI